MSVQTLKKTKQLRRKLREPQQNWKKVLALVERLKKNDAPGNLYKTATENISRFNREQILVVKKMVKISNIYHYWISKEGEAKVIDKRCLRQELYALTDKSDLEKNGTGFCL